MNNVVFDSSMSLGGFITAGNQSQVEPLGEGGQQLHTWIKDAGILNFKGNSRGRRYHLDAASLNEAFGWLTRYHIFWKGRFGALINYLETKTNDR